MERGSGKSEGWRCRNIPEDLELAEEGVQDPAQPVDSEAEEEDEAAVASPNLESSGELMVSLLKEELVKVETSSSPSNFSIQDINKEKEVPLRGDPLKSVADSLDEVDVTSHPNKNPFSSMEGICPDGMQDSGDLDSSPQPSLSKGAWLNGSLPLNPEDHSDEMMREENNGDAPVEPEQEAGEKTRVVYTPKVEKFKGPAWDSEKDVNEFCKAFSDAFNKIAKESEDEKKAKEAAIIEKKENRRNAKAAMLVEQMDRKRTRLQTGAIARQLYTSKEEGHSSPQSCSTLRRQGQKRKRSQAETSRELSPVATLRRPLSPRPGPSVFRAPLPPPPPPTPRPTLPSSESGTSQCEDEGLPAPDEKDTNCQP